MARIIDEWGLQYPGVKKVEHVYFYGVPVADDETRRSYLERAYKLGKEFTRSSTARTGAALGREGRNGGQQIVN
jgi:hypothetical protein